MIYFDWLDMYEVFFILFIFLKTFILISPGLVTHPCVCGDI